MPLSFAGSETVALCLESITYGIYLVLFVACLNIIWHKRKEHRTTNKTFVFVSLALFSLITWHIIIDAVRLIFSYKHELTAEADLYYSEFRSAMSLIKTSIYLGITIVSDSFMLHRTYIIFNRYMPIMIVPFLLLIADIATGIAAVVSLAQLNPSQTFFVVRQARFTESFFATTLALNGLCTGLIAFRIWKSQRTVNKAINGERVYSMTRLDRLTIIILESGAIYATTLLLVLATYVGEATAAFNIFLDITSPVIGIVFSLIIVRVSLGLKPDGTGEEFISTARFARNMLPNTITSGTYDTKETNPTMVRKMDRTVTTLQQSTSAVDHIKSFDHESDVELKDIVFASPKP